MLSKNGELMEAADGNSDECQSSEEKEGGERKKLAGWAEKGDLEHRVPITLAVHFPVVNKQERERARDREKEERE